MKRIFSEFHNSGGISGASGRLLRRYCGILCAVAVASVALAPASYAQTRGYFNFNPDSIKGKDVVVVTVEGMVINDFEIMSDCITGKKSNRNTGGVNEAVAPPSRVTIDMNALLRQRFKEAKLNYLIVPLGWSGHTRDNARAVSDFVKWLPRVCAAAKAQKKPVYLFSYSWGTMIAYEALRRLEQNPKVHIDKFITCGSMLEPEGFVMRRFTAVEGNGVRKQVLKPLDVGTWLNFWAHRDMYSNQIKEADDNFRIDEGADDADSQLVEEALASDTGKARRQILYGDREKLSDPDVWHQAYFRKYSQYFASVQSQVNVDAFKDYIAGALTGEQQ